MRRLFPLFSALACLLFWGMLPVQGATASWQGADAGKVGEKFSPLPAADLEGGIQSGGLDAGEGPSDLTTETRDAVLLPSSMTAPRESVRLGDRRPATLVGIVVLLI